MVPDGWVRLPLEKVAQVRTGISLGTREIEDPITVPYLRVANVQDGWLDLEHIKEVQIDRRYLERYSLRHGDVLMTEGGDFDKLGRGHVWNGAISPCLHQNHVFAVRAGNLIEPHFLSALASSPYGRSYFLYCAKKSTNLASINATQLKDFPVLLPPVAEQKEIVRVLETWERAIGVHKNLINTAIRQRKSLAQQLLTGKRRLPGFVKPWVTASIGTLTTLVSRPVIWDDDAEYSLLSVRRRSGGVFLRAVMRGSDIKTKSMFTVQSGDFLISRMQVVHGAMATVGKDFDGMHVSGSYSVLKSNHDRLVPEFLGWWSTTPRARHAALRSSYGVHIEKMTFNLPLFVQEKVSIPSEIEEQHAICRVLTAAEKIEQAHLAQLKILELEKRALMQQLLTGKRRVKLPPEHAVPATEPAT